MVSCTMLAPVRSSTKRFSRETDVMAIQHTIGMDTKHFVFDKMLSPVLRVRHNDTIVVETEDADNSLITKETDVFADFNALYDMAGGTNPVSGPIYVDGAHPGDCLEVDILEIQPAPWRHAGYTALYANLGALQDNRGSLQAPLEPRTKICAIKDGMVHFAMAGGGKVIRIPVDPFIGTIGVAPREDRCSAGKMGQDFCGNVDIPALRAGSTVVLPVNVEGALLSLGDVHACQGDGEITGCALECQARVTIRVRATSAEEARYGAWPQVRDERYLGVIVPLGYANYTEAMKIGYTELVHLMAKWYGFDALDAYQLLNLAGEIRMGSEYSCLCRIDKKYLQ